MNIDKKTIKILLLVLAVIGAIGISAYIINKDMKKNDLSNTPINHTENTVVSPDGDLPVNNLNQPPSVSGADLSNLTKEQRKLYDDAKKIETEANAYLGKGEVGKAAEAYKKASDKYFQSGQFDKAAEMAKKSEDLYRQQSDENHSSDPGKSFEQGNAAGNSKESKNTSTKNNGREPGKFEVPFGS